MSKNYAILPSYDSDCILLIRKEHLVNYKIHSTQFTISSFKVNPGIEWVFKHTKIKVSETENRCKIMVLKKRGKSVNMLLDEEFTILIKRIGYSHFRCYGLIEDEIVTYKGIENYKDEEFIIFECKTTIFNRIIYPNILTNKNTQFNKLEQIYKDKLLEESPYIEKWNFDKLHHNNKSDN